MSVSLKEIRVDRTDEGSLTYCNVGGDRCFEIIVDETVTIGHIFITEDTELANCMRCPTYINWLEFLTIYQGKGLLRPVMDVIAERFGIVYFESSDGNKIKYRRIGAKSLGVDEITELEIFSYGEKKKKK